MSVLDKFKYGTKQISEMYLGTSVVKSVYFGSTLIWEKSSESKVLVAGSQNIAVKYVPVEDMTVTEISIFTADAVTSTSSYIKIMHESGICVGYVHVDSFTATTKYTLEGYKRTATFSGVNLKSGETYYIMFAHGWNGDFFPAYFSGVSGEYKTFFSQSDATVIDASNYNYIGAISPTSGYDTIFNADENDYWNCATGFSDVFQNMNINNTYARTSSYKDMTYAGQLATPVEILDCASNEYFLYTGENINQNYNYVYKNYLYKKLDTFSAYASTTLTGTDKINVYDEILSLPANSIFTMNSSYGNLYQNYTYVKNSAHSVSDYIGIQDDDNISTYVLTGLTSGQYFLYDGSYTDWNIFIAGNIIHKNDNVIDDVIDVSKYNGNYDREAALLYAMQNEVGHGSYVSGNSVWYNYQGQVANRTDFGNVCITSMTPIATSAEMTSTADGTIHYAASGFEYSGNKLSENAVIMMSAAKTSGFSLVDQTLMLSAMTMSAISNYYTTADISAFTTREYLANCVSALDRASVFKQLTNDTNFMTAANYTDKKFYLEINGTEV